MERLKLKLKRFKLERLKLEGYVRFPFKVLAD